MRRMARRGNRFKDVIYGKFADIEIVVYSIIYDSATVATADLLALASLQHYRSKIKAADLLMLH